MEDQISDDIESVAPQMNDQLSIKLEKEMADLSSYSPYCCIFRVYDRLRNVNSKAYEPTLIAIGPYHKGNVKLQMMEDRKLHYFKILLEREGISINKLVILMQSLEEEARRCYAEPISLDSEKFIRMLLLDGCFIIELARKNRDADLREEYDPIFQHDWIFYDLMRDLMLFENQLPLFVLLTISINLGYVKYELYNLFVIFFKDNSFPFSSQYKLFTKENVPEIKHLHELIYFCWLGAPSKNESEGMTTESFIGCATQLKEANIKFKKIDEGCGILGIKFSGGVFDIPQLTIDDMTESFLRNMIAYEQYHLHKGCILVTSYINLMDCLINSPKDVELLCQRGIIQNCLGNDEVVAEIFNKMLHNVILPINYQYAEIFKNVIDHCEKPYNKRIASLRHNYLNSPWALISVLAAVVLLIFTITQTFFTIFPRK